MLYCIFFFFFFFFFSIYMAGLLQTGTISRYNTAESHSLMHYSQLCGTHQPRLCALELLPKEFTGGISDDPCRALHSNAARPRHTCAALITLLPNSLTCWVNPWHMVKTLAKGAAWRDRTRDRRVGSVILYSGFSFVVNQFHQVGYIQDW